MPHGWIKSETFCKRAFSCAFYKEDDNYAKNARLFLGSILKEYKNNSNDGSTRDLSRIFNKRYAAASFSKKRYVYKKDKVNFKKYCQNCITNLSSFLDLNITSNFLEDYAYGCRIRGNIGCRATVCSKGYTVDFSTYTNEDTYHRLYYHKFNTWLYNKVNGLKNDILVVVLPSDTYYLIKYDEKDYTIKRGYVNTRIKNPSYSPGYQCRTCSIKHCKPRLINTLDRLSLGIS